MFFKKNALTIICFLLASAISSTTIQEQKHALENRIFSERAKTITISLPETASVADLIRSKKRGHEGLNIPTVPRFSKRYPFSLARILGEYKGHYKLRNGAMLTSAAMERFTNLAHLLLADNEEQAQKLREKLDAAIQAHIDWCPCKTTHYRGTPSISSPKDFTKKNVNAMSPEERQAKLMKLQSLEDEIFEILKKIPLKEPSTRVLVEKILSTSYSPTLDYIALNVINSFEDKDLFELLGAKPSKTAQASFINGEDKALLQQDKEQNVRILALFLYGITKQFFLKVLPITLAIQFLCLIPTSLINFFVENATFKDTVATILSTGTIIPAAFLLVRKMHYFGKDLRAGEFNQVAEPNYGINVRINLVSEASNS